MENLQNKVASFDMNRQYFWAITRQSLIAAWLLCIALFSPLVNAQTQTLTGTISLPGNSVVTGDVRLDST